MCCSLLLWTIFCNKRTSQQFCLRRTSRQNVNLRNVRSRNIDLRNVEIRTTNEIKLSFQLRFNFFIFPFPLIKIKELIKILQILYLIRQAFLIERRNKHGFKTKNNYKCCNCRNNELLQIAFISNFYYFIRN